MSQPAATAQQSALLNLLALGNFVVGMGAFVVIGIVTPIADGLAVSKSSAGTVLTAYAIAYALLSPLGAAITGTWPRRDVLTAALALFCIGSILSALSSSLTMLAASRIIVAFGAALYTPLSAGVAVAIAGAENRGRALAKVFGGITMAQVVGVPAGAWLAYRFGWPSTFWTVSVLSAAAAAIIYRMVPRAIPFQATGITAVVTALKDVPVMFATAFTAVIIAAIYMVFTYFGPLIEASVGSNPETRTLFLVLYGVGAVAGNYAGGFLTDRIGPNRTLYIVCTAQAVVMPLFSVVPWSPVMFAILVGIWSSFGWSFMAPQQSRLVAIAPKAQPLVLALNAAMIYVGIAVGSALSALVLDWRGIAGLGVAGGGLALAAALYLWLSGRIAERPANH